MAGTPTTGGAVTIEARGYQPNEQGIIVVIYSDPIVLGTVAADASGTARWSGKLPSSLTGTHTLTMQGTVSHGAVVSLRPAVAKTAADICTISDASLVWGFKESFRAYLSSSIAHGEWTVADGAEYSTPDFSWTGDGSLNPETQSGELAFVGSVRFTGHGGVLDTTITNPRVVLSSDGAVLLLDVTGTTQDGSAVDSHGVEFARLDLSAVSPEEGDSSLTWTAIPAVLTEAGSAAFGTYGPGEVLDPITLTIPLPSDCGVVVASDSASDSPEVTSGPADGQSGGQDLAWLWWLLGAIALIAILAAAFVIIRRRNAA